MKVKVWKLLGLIFIAIFTLSAASASATPTMSSVAGTYVEQTSSGTGYNIVLYENGTALFSSHSGTWSIVNSTTIAGTYSILSAPRTDYFTITNDGFTAVQTGNVYIKTTSASTSPTASPSASSTVSSSSTPIASVSPSPTVPEFSTSALILVVGAIVVVSLCTIGLAAKKRRAKRFN
jgi:hypothetical protein